jgi:hypothetical protein
MNAKKVDFRGLCLSTRSVGDEPATRKPASRSIKRDAEVHRYCYAEAIIKLFRTAHHGRDAASVKELSDWVATWPKSKNINSYKVLTKDKIDATVKSALTDWAAKKGKK